ncbi:hypothetical protein SKUN_001717 (plasmid) [Spiroplasma kunkelii CR2-3x]|uniref:Uncharacterized protein n=1 Tax=Spiroplasma kunkelii CR2-3x TaxID=273035 RepID=A0A0K2JJ05_SPIKU|nr:hypothetical protein [Spiroplasma kunkelii]ALA98574.1 hypothetical protein SKUN_001717 [Spiroplasma kunkelii CR2-3x]
MKLDENICIAPHCEKITLLVMPAISICSEHEKQFMEYIDNLPFIPELNEILETDKKAHFQFILANLTNFFEKLEKEWNRKNKYNIKKKKPKKKRTEKEANRKIKQRK